MKKKSLLQTLNPFKIPRDSKELFGWLIKLLFTQLGCSGSLGFVAILLVALTLFGFLIGDYLGNGNGTPNGSTVTLGTQTEARNKAILSAYNAQANRWQQGLSSSQIAQVEQQGVNLPGAVLLAVGKMENNMTPMNASLYYGYLQPSFTWQTFTDETIHYVTHKPKLKLTGVKKAVHLKSHTTRTVTRTLVTMLVSANTWDGTLSDTYKWVTSMSGNTKNGTFTRQIELATPHRTYNWSRVWGMFKALPEGTSTKTHRIAPTKENQQMLAGLIGAVDYTVTDPYVQQMVSTVLFPSGTVAVLPGTVPTSVPAANGNVVDDVVRWKKYIQAASSQYRVPAVLIAGVMAQESGGHETDGTGHVLESSAGALGLMQVEPSTAAGMVFGGQEVGTRAVADLSSAVTNIELGAMYLSELYHEFGDNAEAAESAYNAGPGGEEQAIASGYTIAQNSQTLAYVANIQGAWIPALTSVFGPE